MGLTADSGMLNVRWSTEDPNSGARKRKERDAERALLAAAREAETDAEAHKAKQLRAERAAAEADEALLAEALAEEAVGRGGGRCHRRRLCRAAAAADQGLLRAAAGRDAAIARRAEPRAQRDGGRHLDAGVRWRRPAVRRGVAGGARRRRWRPVVCLVHRKGRWNRGRCGVAAADPARPQGVDDAKGLDALLGLSPVRSIADFGHGDHAWCFVGVNEGAGALPGR